MNRTSEFMAEVAADNRALAYRCRWSVEDARRVVPELTRILSLADEPTVHEALRSLITIGTPAVGAATSVVRLTKSGQSMTRRLAILALGSIAHSEPSLCVGPVTDALNRDECRDDALRILIFLGKKAKKSLADVISCYESKDAKTRRLALRCAISIEMDAEATRDLMARAADDRSKTVRAVLRFASSQPN